MKNIKDEGGGLAQQQLGTRSCCAPMLDAVMDQKDMEGKAPLLVSLKRELSAYLLPRNDARVRSVA